MIETGIIPRSEKVVNFNELVAKYQLSDRLTVRAYFNIDREHNTKTAGEYSPIIGNVGCDERSTLYGFGGGLQYRLLPRSKVSPYVGFEIRLHNKASKAEYSDIEREFDEPDISVTSKLHGAWRERIEHLYVDDYGYSYSSVTYPTERAFRSVGVNLLFGTDFYLVRNLYFGFEAGLGYTGIYNKQISLTETDKNGERTYLEPSRRDKRFGFCLNRAIRVGIWF